MAPPSISIKATQSVVGLTEEITAMLKKVQKGQRDESTGRFTPHLVMGELQIAAGHDYWVVQEYGASPADEGADDAAEDGITLPEGINPGKHHSSRYAIHAVFAKHLWFIDKHGNRRRDQTVFHPGVVGRGFIRRATHSVFNALAKDMATLVLKEMPDREDLAELVNRHLIYLLDAVRASSPVNVPDEDGPDPRHKGHLRDAWSVTLAH